MITMAKLLLLYIKSKALQNQQLKIRIILTAINHLKHQLLQKLMAHLLKLSIL